MIPARAAKEKTMVRLRKNSPRSHVRSILLSIMDEGLKTGSYNLPSERELSEKLSVSRVTVRNALDELVRREYIIKIPRRGNIINKNQMPPLFYAGILNDDGAESCHYGDISQFTECLSLLCQNQCAVKIVSAPNLNGRLDLLMANHGLDGLLWLSPSWEMLDEIKAMEKSAGMPVISVVSLDYPSNPLSCNYVSFDYAASGRKRAEFFISRGHKNVAYLGNRGATHNSFCEFFRSAGINARPEYFIEREAEIPERLPGLLRKGKITGIVSNGPRVRLEELFQILSDFSGRTKIALRVDYVAELPELLLKYPMIKPDVVCRVSRAGFASAAVRMLLRAMTEQKPQPPELFDTWTPESMEVLK
jgi:hypothetical protein